MHSRDSNSIGRLGVGLAVLLVGLLWGLPGHAQSAERVGELLSQWEYDRAKSILDELGADARASPRRAYLRARLAFLDGRYDEASNRLDQVFHNREVGGNWKRFRKLVDATREVTKNYEKQTTADGRFVFYYPPGVDQALVPYASEALDRAYEALGDELGHRPPTPIRVEIYPRTSTLAKVSGLTENDIRQSGTIALCKFNRLMITSPKALLQGYDWVDTLIHEYVHYVINHKTTENVPIWMHEGLAKFLEHRWRGPDANRLPPSAEYLLAKRLEKDDLISFDAMHPSMAKLPSQEDAATAFAEVYTVMEYLRRQAGDSALRRLLEAISAGKGAKGAVEEVAGSDFETFKADWKSYLAERETPDFPDRYRYQKKKVFKDETSSDSKKADKPDQSDAKDHFELGEMLQAKQRFEAAVAEYRKAMAMTDSPHVRLRTQLAQSLNEVGRPTEAVDVLEPARKFYRSSVHVWLQLGRARVKEGSPELARDALLEAVWINPFNPEIHRYLAKAYDQLGDDERAARERRFAKLVQ